MTRRNKVTMTPANAIVRKAGKRNRHKAEAQMIQITEGYVKPSRQRERVKLLDKGISLRRISVGRHYLAKQIQDEKSQDRDKI